MEGNRPSSFAEMMHFLSKKIAGESLNISACLQRSTARCKNRGRRGLAKYLSYCPVFAGTAWYYFILLRHVDQPFRTQIAKRVPHIAGRSVTSTGAAPNSTLCPIGAVAWRSRRRSSAQARFLHALSLPMAARTSRIRQRIPSSLRHNPMIADHRQRRSGDRTFCIGSTDRPFLFPPEQLLDVAMR